MSPESSNSSSILILEDDPDLREMIADLLREQGYVVVTASRGEEAIELASSRVFDLFIADVRMEGMGGLAAIEKTRDHQPDLGSLVISGWASEEQTLEAVRLQVGGYLKKPFSMNEFLDRVRELLAERAQQKAREAERAVLSSSALWALGVLAHTVDRAALLGPRGALGRVAELSSALARQFGLPEQVVDQIRVGAPVATLIDLSEFEPPPELVRVGTLSTLFSLLRDHTLEAAARSEPDGGGLGEASLQEPEGQSTLPARIAALARTVALGDPNEPLPSVDELQSRYPNLYEDELLQAYQRLEPELTSGAIQSSFELLSGLGNPSRLQRSLLSLAETMESSGDAGSAVSAYQKVLEQNPSSAEAISACLGMARLGRRQGDAEEAAAWALKAPRIAKAMGPSAFGQAALSCGLILQSLAHPQAIPSLRTSVKMLDRVGLQGSAALARLALREEPVPDGDLLLLCEPSQWGLVGRHLSWLLPRLLEIYGQCSEPMRESLERLLLAYSDALVAAEPELTQQARQALLDLIERRPDRVGANLARGLAGSSDMAVRDRAARLLEGACSSPLLRLHSLGLFRAFLGSDLIEDGFWRTQKTKYLLAHLAAHPGQALRAEVLVEVFWPDTRAKAEQNLWAAVSAIRRILKPGNFVVRAGQTLSLNWDLPIWHDLRELERLLGELTSGELSKDDPRFGALCQRVSELYTGSYLEGCYLDWAVRRRGLLEERVVVALTDGAHHFLRQASFPEALEMAERAVHLDPLRGQAYLMKMRAHLGLGQPEQTVATFESCRSMLAREFELEPTTAMLEVVTRARHGMPDSGD